MNDVFRLRCIGLIDDELIDVAINRIGKIKNERRIKAFSTLAAAVLIMVVTPIGVINYRNFERGSIVDDLPFSEMPVIEVDNNCYQAIGEKNRVKYGLNENPDSSLINEFVGTYDFAGRSMTVNVFTSTVSQTNNILLGECDDTFFYMVFCNKINDGYFDDAMSFLDFFGYNSATDIVSMSVDGKEIKDREMIEKFWGTIFNSSLETFDDYSNAIYQGKWTNDKAQENYNSSVVIELNVGMPSYLQIRYSSLAGFFISHECYLKIV